jgi:single-strand DNA-binding protein
MVTLIGRLGADVEERAMPNGQPVANFRVATSEKWKDKQTGDMKELTEWHSVVAFGRTAEIARQYLSKGSLVCVLGRLRTRKYQDKQGNDRYSTEVITDRLSMLGSRSGGADSGTAREARAMAAPQSTGGTTDFADDDIPF